MGQNSIQESTSKIAIFTIASKNYFAYVRTLMQSLESSNPDMDRYVVVVDDIDEEFASLPRNFELIDIDSLNLPHPKQMEFRYDIMEMNTAVKPFAILKLFETYDRVIYLDPDIYVYKQLTPVVNAMDDGKDIILTPHFNHLFKEDGLHPDEHTIMKSGIYNLGFIALQKSEDSLEMVYWWAHKLEKECVNDQANGVFVDQKWIDLVPGLYKNVIILHDSGMNVAYWNLTHRKITKVNGEFEVNGEPLIFFHFSGLNPNNIFPVSKHQDRYNLQEIGDGSELFEDYSRKVLSNDFDMWKKYQYSYSSYTDGRKVLDEHRKEYIKNFRLQGFCGENPFAYADIFYGDKEMDLKSGGINLIGYICSEHGLGEASRLTANCLEAANIPWIAYDFEVGNFSPKDDNTYKTKIQQYVKYNISIININADQFHTLCNNTPHELWDTYRIGIWYWELPEFPEKWLKAFSSVDEIWAPTQFIADCLQKYAPCPVFHMPPGIERPKVDENIYNRDYFNLPQDAFLFLNMFDIYSFSGRKNPEAAVKAFQLAFSEADMSVGLVLKINNAGYDNEVKSSLETLIGNYKNIYIISATLSRDEVNGLTNTCNAAVSLHRSEGLGLLCEESMCYGKPVIATAWSGNMDFMTPQNSCLVDYKLCKVGKDIGPYEAWQEWADPDIEQASEYMKRLVSDSSYAEDISKEAKKTIAEQFSPKVCGARMAKRLDQINQLIENGYKQDAEKEAYCFARACIPYYEDIMNCSLSEDKKEDLIKSWVKNDVVDFDKIAEDIKDSGPMLVYSNDEFITNCYKILLGRVPSDAEISRWVNQLGKNSRAYIISSFLRSKEFMEGYSEIYDNAIKGHPSVQKTVPNKTSAIPQNDNKNFKAVNSVWKISYYFDLQAGKIKSFFERFIRRVLRFLFKPLVDQQCQFNADTVRCLNELNEKQHLLVQQHNAVLEQYNNLLKQQNEIVNTQKKLSELEKRCNNLYSEFKDAKMELNGEMESNLHKIQDDLNVNLSAIQADLNSIEATIKEEGNILQSNINQSVDNINIHSTELKNTILEAEGSRHNQLVHYFMEIKEKENHTLDPTEPEMVKQLIKDKWAAVDEIEEKYITQNHQLKCPICQAEFFTDDAEKLTSECIFNGGKLIRYRCPECGVVFGPEKMFALSEDAFSDDYSIHYSVYPEGDCTEQEIELFYKLSPRKDGLYLDYGAGAWSKTIETLRADGYQVYGYDPYAPTDSEYIIKDEDVLRTIKFDGIFSHDLLEHLRDPLATFRLYYDILKPDGIMLHSTACFDYVYEYTRFHLFFYTGNSVEKICEETGFKITDIGRDPINLIINYRFEKQNIIK